MFQGLHIQYHCTELMMQIRLRLYSKRKQKKQIIYILRKQKKHFIKGKLFDS